MKKRSDVPTSVRMLPKLLKMPQKATFIHTKRAVKADIVHSKDSGNEDFIREALQIFRYQSGYNPVYKKYLELRRIQPEKISDLRSIPFLPISFFKTHEVTCHPGSTHALVFESSGTTGTRVSRHHVFQPEKYLNSIETGFRHFFGEPENFAFFGIVPSATERKHSSLVFMISHLMQLSKNTHGGFFYENFQALEKAVDEASRSGKTPFIIGITYALLELASRSLKVPANSLVVETGGMKGHGTELIREEVHVRFKQGLGIDTVSSEYGMTELLSQAWSIRDGIFHCPPGMKVFIRDPEVPSFYLETGKTGAINVIDLANEESCSFIATDDLGRMREDGGFEVLGRLDHSDLRGCNLL